MKPFFALAPLAGLIMIAPAAPAIAQSAQLAVQASDAGQFVDKLADTAFGVLRSKSGSRAAARSAFRDILRQNFAVKQIGDSLIRRWQGKITPAQQTAYDAAFPDFVVNTYADNLYAYVDADLTVTRTVPVGSGWAVYTQVTKPGAQPISAMWSVVRGGHGYQVTNLTVAGINLKITQSADFDSYIQRRGFDALVAFMKTRRGS